MADKPEGDKTEAPTPKRRADARKNGDILQSKELGGAIVMLAGAAWLALAGPWFAGACLTLLRDGLTFDARATAVFDPAEVAVRLMAHAALPMAALMGIAFVATLAAPAILGSLGMRGGAMAFKGNRIDPLAGLKRIFGPNGLIELGKSLAKAAVLGLLGWWLVMRDLPRIVGLGATDIPGAAAALGGMVVTSTIWLALGLALIALIDVPIQIVRRNGRLRMTKQEVKEEMRQSEGAPEMKAARHRHHQQLLTGSARKAVTEANVILTNPTHFAVALRYRPGIDFAPIVVARGRGETAQAIKALAVEAKVPRLEYPRLTRAIYFTARAGQPVAEDLYMAVATILAFVFNLDRALAEGTSAPGVDVPDAKWFDEHGKPDARGA